MTRNEPASSVFAGPWICRVMPALLLPAVTLLAYLPVLGGGFVWDDAHHLIDNLVLRENGLFRVWFTAESVNYWPMTWSSYWLEFQIWGLDPRGYHVSNVLLHGLNAVLAWRVLRRLEVPGAWLAAAVFALHPVNVESAAWITQRKNTLCLFFYLISILSYLRSNGRGPLYAASVAAFLLSMLSKGAGVTLPVTLLLIAWWRRGRLTRRDLADAMPFFAVAFLMSGVEILFQYERTASQGVRGDSMLDRLAGVGWVVWFYLGKAFLPVHLAFVYPKWTIGSGRLIAWLPDLALGAVFAALWAWRTSAARHALVALGFFVSTLAPVLGVVEFYYLKYSFVGDHYQYIAILGPIAWAVGSITHLTAGHLRPRIAVLAASALLATLFALTWRSSERFVDYDTLWRTTIVTNPDAALAHFNLALSLQEKDRLGEAEEHYREVIRIDPTDSGAHNNLGSIEEARGNDPQAIEHYRLALEAEPGDARARNNLAGALRRSGRLDEAIRQYRLALEASPENASVHLNAALALGEAGRIDEAVAEARRALEIDPAALPARMQLAGWLRARGRLDEAATELRRVIARDPRNARAHLELGRVLVEAGAPGQALRHYRIVRRLEPGWEEPLRELERLETPLDPSPAQRTPSPPDEVQATHGDDL
jgi:tetratricopeptide (TPR) repeat protein